MSPPRATHDADCTDDRWTPRCQFFKLESGLAPAYQHLLPSAIPVGFKVRTNPSQSHRISFTVTNSLCREGDKKWPIRGHTASVPSEVPSLWIPIFSAPALLQAARRSVCGDNLRWGKLAFGHVRFHSLQPSWPSVYQLLSHRSMFRKDSPPKYFAPKALLGRPHPWWVCHSPRCQAHLSIHHFCIRTSHLQWLPGSFVSGTMLVLGI